MDHLHRCRLSSPSPKWEHSLHLVMSPKNARLKTNGDQSSSASIRTDAILGVEVSAIRVRSEAPKLAWRARSRFCLPVDLNSGHIFQSFDNCWIVVAASRAESARKYHSFTFYLLCSTNRSDYLNQRPQACLAGTLTVLPTRGFWCCDLINQIIEIRGLKLAWRARSRFCLPVDFYCMV